MKTKAFLLAGFAWMLLPLKAAEPASASSPSPVITVYKDPDCGCCKSWVEYMRKHGFRIDAKDTRDMNQIKANLGVPKSLVACHTAIVGGYIVEGHVPAGDIQKLLKQKPKIAGIAVAGMPGGSPGMEGPPPVHYKVIAFERTGKTHVFATH